MKKPVFARKPLFITAIFFYTLLFSDFFLSPAIAQTAKIDSLLKKETQLPDDTLKAMVLNDLTHEYYRSDIRKFHTYLEKTLDLNEKLGYRKGMSRAKSLQAIAFFLKNDLKKAIELNLEALDLAEEVNYKDGIFIISKDLGILFRILGDYEQSLFYSQKSLETQIVHGAVAYAYENMGELHAALGNRKEEKKYIDLSIETAKASNDPKILAHLYHNMGLTARKKGSFQEAIQMFNTCREYAQGENDSLYLALSNSGTANVYKDQGKNRAAARTFQKALSLLPDSYEAEHANITVALADVYTNLKDYTGAIQAIKKVEKEARKITILVPIMYRILSEAHEGLGQFEEALAMKSAQLDIQDSLSKVNNTETIAKLETRYQLKERQAENEQLKQQSEAQQQELLLTKNIVRQQRIITFGTIIGLIVTTGLLIYVFRLIQKLRHTNVQLKKQSSDLRIARDKAESAAKAKSEFLSVMSHEIRTPMNAVIGMTHLLMDEEPRNDQMEYLDTLQFSGTNLIALINDILDFSKIEAGKLTLEQADLDLESLVKSITASTAIKGNDKGIEVKYSYDPELADMYIGDSVRLGQVLTNLMGNAVKFTEEGYVELQVAPVDENKLRFSVKDTGIGIPKDKQKQIFEAFSQAADDTTRKFGGTGLGLSISRRLVELMGGELQIESEPGEGSVFFFEIELPKSDTPKKTQTEKAESGKLSFGSLAGTRVLVAEDNKINQMVVRKFLEKWDLDITIANNGQEAVEAWEKEQFDLILMDVNMPVLNGHEATRKIREHEKDRNEHMPILAFTASVVEDEIKAIYDAGMDDWVSKPFEPSVLYQKIRKYGRKPAYTDL